LLIGGFFFFFSSRRRHTRFSRDWSSDVCSSDLAIVLAEETGWGIFWIPIPFTIVRNRLDQRRRSPDRGQANHSVAGGVDLGIQRSEERRVGKECRSRGGPAH